MRLAALRTTAAVALLVGSTAQAQSFAIAHDVHCAPDGATYIGAQGYSCGGVSDGGFDAFDGYGWYSTLPGGLTLSRRTEALRPQSLYRFFDTFTNSSGAASTFSVTLYGNLGSDGGGHVVKSNDYLHVSSDSWGTGGYDPVIALVYGNNGFARDQMSLSANQSEHYLTTTFTLAAGESRSLLLFAGLARSSNTSWYLSGSEMAASEQAAVAMADGLFADPYVEGLSAEEKARIANFTMASNVAAVPEPGTYALLATGLAGLAVVARRRRA
jgi:hypothetical protein